MTTASSKPAVLAEQWLPVAELGVESRRERAAASALPPLSFLHVWWARRPLVASAGVVLAGLLPAWTSGLAAAHPNRKELIDEASYRAWLLYLVGIWGDPVRARRAYDAAKLAGKRIPNPYEYRQAFRNQVDKNAVDLLHELLRETWGELPSVLDPTAGGGSIPFAASRLGLPTIANDLNGVAVATLHTGVKLPAEHGVALIDELRHWGGELVRRVREDLEECFPSVVPGEVPLTYIWAHAVRCPQPRCGGLVPLIPDLWLRKEKDREVAVRIRVEHEGRTLTEPHFEIVRGKSINFDPQKGLVSRGSAICPYDHLVIDGDHIKAEAQAGHLDEILYAVAVRRPDGSRDFRSPTARDHQAVQIAAQRLMKERLRWEREGYLPTEEIPSGNYDRGHRMYGLRHWSDLFTARQLLVHGTFTRHYFGLFDEIRQALDKPVADAVLDALALMQAKAVNWNARLSSWDQSRQKMRSVFEKHNFSFKWSFAEFEGAQALYPWALDQLLDAYGGLARLYEGAANDLSTGKALPRQVTVTRGSGADLSEVPDGSITHLCMDPPYYDNVQYSELSDFFYVWEKRTLGRLHPDWFADELADRDNEAVANPARFNAFGKRKIQLADADYEAKMTAIFTEARRVLRDDGVLTVMFTHKRAEAWDTLGMGLMTAGFTVETSWPVNTEAEHSLHQAGVNSASSTIMLVCRKRQNNLPLNSGVYLEDIDAEIREAARRAITRFRVDGIDGVDLLLSAYGPTLGVVSQHWPVRSSNADIDGRAELLRPEDALKIARAEIVRVQRARLVEQSVTFDALTDFVLAFWDLIKDSTATYDEARRLALAVGGLDLDDLAQARLVERKSGTVRLLEPAERVRRRGDEGPGVRTSAEEFDVLVDAVHTVCHVAEEDGLGAARALMERTELLSNVRFLAVVQALMYAVPRVREKGAFVVPLAGTLDRLCAAWLTDVIVPKPVDADDVHQFRMAVAVEGR